MIVDTRDITTTLGNVYHVPKMNLNTLSCSHIDKYGITTIIEKNKCKLLNLKNKHRVFGTIHRSESDGLYKVEMTLSDRNQNRTGRSKVNTTRSQASNTIRE